VKIVTVLAMVIALAPLGGRIETAAAQAPATGAEHLYLSGVVVVEGATAKAWLQEPTLTRDKPTVFRVGDKIGRWTLTAISPNRVELDGPGGKIFVPLHGFAGTGRGAGPSGAASVATTGVSPAQGDGPVYIPVGDPRRRESIGQLFDSLRQADGRDNPGPSGAPADSPGPGIATDTAPARPSGKLVLPVGDPRRRDAIRQLFGAR